MNKDNTIEPDKLKDVVKAKIRFILDKYFIVRIEDGLQIDDADIDMTITDLYILFNKYSKELEIEAVIGKLEQVVNGWEHPSLAPYWITDRIKQLEATLKDNYGK